MLIVHDSLLLSTCLTLALGAGWYCFRLGLDALTSSLRASYLHALADMFVTNGDVISMLYTNSPAMHSQVVRAFSSSLVCNGQKNELVLESVVTLHLEGSHTENRNASREGGRGVISTERSFRFNRERRRKKERNVVERECNRE